MSHEPKPMTTTKTRSMAKFIIGAFRARIFSARVKSAHTSCAAAPNFFFSKSWRT